MAKRLGYYDPNKVRPRRNELAKETMVVKVGVRKCTVTDRKAIIWGIWGFDYPSFPMEQKTKNACV